MQPVRDYRPWWLGFYIMFLVVGGFLMMNLFCGVVVDNFMEMTEVLGGDVMLTGTPSTLCPGLIVW